MDCSDPNNVVNFRDVGAFVNLIAGRELLREYKLLRGGTVQYIEDTAVAGNPRTILCLKNGANRPIDGVDLLHHPRPNTANCYQTGELEVRSWLKAVVRSLVEPPIALPLYVHCHSGG